MTKKRHIDSDKRATARVMQLAASGHEGELGGSPNWLGHTRGCTRLDKALVNGATMKELKAIRGAITQHFDHLRIEHGLHVNKVGDVYRLTVPK